MSRRDTVRESNSFCSRVSSAMRRLYLRAFKKTMPSLHLSEWLEWKCKIAAESLGFLCRVVESLWSASCGSSRLVRISVRSIVQDEFDCGLEFLPRMRFPRYRFPRWFFVANHEEVGIWWGNFGSQGCAKRLEKNVHMNVKLFFLMMVSSNIRILW